MASAFLSSITSAASRIRPAHWSVVMSFKAAGAVMLFAIVAVSNSDEVVQVGAHGVFRWTSRRRCSGPSARR